MSRKYHELQRRYQDAGRCAEPGEDDQQIQSFQMDFGMGVYISPEDQRKLHDIFDAIVDRPCNQPKEGCHWLSGSGSKPSFSKADSAFLGKPVDPDAPDTGEPTFDDSILYFESTARAFVSDEERERKHQRRTSHAH